MKHTWTMLLGLLLATSTYAEEAVTEQPVETATEAVEATTVAAPEAVTEAPAQPAEPAPAEPAAPAPVKVVVLLPERVDGEWFWFYYGMTEQHLVQTAVEKELIRAGFDIIDAASLEGLKQAGSIDRVTSAEFARDQAASAGAQYAIVGQATAVRASSSTAYGVGVVRSNAEVTAKIIRISDGKVLSIEDASALKGGQAAPAAGQEALKEAGKVVARKVVGSLRRVSAQ